MDVHQLRVFAAVYRNRSFSKASEELYLTQPTVSDHIKALEDDLGCRLFDRLGRTIIPTKEAEVLYGNAVEIIEKTAALKELVGRFRKEISGELVVGASTIPGTYLLPSIMAEFQGRHPMITFQVIISDSKEITEKVLSHDLRLGIVGSKPSNAQIHAAPFVEDELILIAPPSFDAAGGLSIRDLKDHSMVFREAGSGTRQEMERILEGKRLSLDQIKVSGFFGSTDAVKQAVKAGLGLAVVSRSAVVDEVRLGTLKEVRLRDVQMRRRFYVITHRKRVLPPPYQAFLVYLKGYQRSAQRDV